jgi:hypothetical protein
MGRNSVEATKASLIRAVFAALAALLARLVCFFARAPDFAVFLAPASVLADFLPPATVLAVFRALACGSAGTLALETAFAVLLALTLGLTGFFVFFALDEAELPCCVGEPLVLWPPRGAATIRTESTPASKRASREAEVG